MLSSFASILSIALLIPSISGTPIKRADEVQCKLQSSGGPLVLTKSYGPTNSDDGIYVALSASNQTVTKNGEQARFLTTKKPDGSAFTREESNFDFYSCDSKHEGYTTVNEGKSTTYYGHIAPHVASPPAKHCLTYQSNDANSASNNLMLSATCSFVDDKSQTLNFWSLSTYYSAFAFVGHPKGTTTDHRYVTIADDGSVHFKHSGSADSSGEVEYSFIGPH